MNEERMLQVLVAPRMSEKAMRLSGERQYVFRVLNDATKPEIRTAVEKLFNVQVENVRVLNVRAVGTHFRGRVGAHSGWKKAYVTLKPGFTIDLGGA
ncbi:MAG TPA: 50S ribosomal protein L23 [Gammaproteobacteria bacterium]|nr:50S ribosomal protein L23 [Gammaproteobacteria bacterium]